MDCIQKESENAPNTRVLRCGRFVLAFIADKNETIYEDLLFENRSNVKDAMIGEMVKREGCFLVTDDTKFISKLQGNPLHLI